MSGSRAWLFATALGLALFACGPDAVAPGDATVLRIESLQLRFGGSPAMRDDGASLDARALDSLGGFRSVPLPDYWTLNRRRRGLDGWYRGSFAVEGSPIGWAIAVDGSWASLRVFVNGERLVDSIAADRPAPVPVFAAGALVVPLPRTLLHDGTNEVALHFSTRPDEIGGLRTLAIGPTRALAGLQRNLLLWSSTLPRLLGLFALSCGLLVVMLARWSVTSGTLWLGLGTTLWSAAALLAPLASSPSSLFGNLIATAAHAFPPCIALGFLRALGLHRPRVEATLLGSVAIGAIARALVAPVWIPVVDNLWWFFDAGIGLYVLRLALASVRRNAVPAPRFVLAATAIVLAAGIFDLSSLIAGRSFAGLSLFVVASPLIGLATAAGLVTSLSHALDEAQRLNTDLEQRVEEKRRELDASYARTALLERDRAIAAERARMMRDMHDGTGGQLVSALAMVEGGALHKDEVAEALREALSDLRLVINSLEPGDPDLLALLAHARARLEPRLERHGLHFAWEVEDIPAPDRFGPEQSLHVMRVFQEAVTNALKHAHATTIWVRTGVARDADGHDCAYVEIADDGGGFETNGGPTPTVGRGLRNMHRRAEELGGVLLVSSAAHGTRVRLMLPLRPRPS